ncbi:MAG: hypothetical protein HFF17_02095 [Oscillospiraceae bacterium]|nr:hypothetical protein [Oscillospiraceae bacterium]
MKQRVRYAVEPRSWLGWGATGLMILAMALRLIWWIGWSRDWEAGMWVTQALLPMLSCLLFIAALQRFGLTALWTTFIPVMLGVLFFILKADSFVWWHRLLCTLLYLVVAVLYGLAVFGLPIRALLIPLFALPLAFHLLVENLAIHKAAYSAAEWLQEGSVLCIMAALLCTALAMKRQALE